MVTERFPEYRMVMNPGITPSVQSVDVMQWGFAWYETYSYSDKFRNGKFLTTSVVYRDVTRVNNEATGFGVAPNSYRYMFGNGKDGVQASLPEYTGRTTGAPYYYPEATGNIYHPIYKSSAGRYCHEKNRDLNGDGIIDASEIHWYLPAQHELLLMLISLPPDEYAFAGYTGFRSVTEAGERNMVGVSVDIGQSYVSINSSEESKFIPPNYAVRCCKVLK